MSFPGLETTRLRMRPFGPADVDPLHRLWTDAQVRRFLWDDLVIDKERAASEVEASLRSFEAHGFGHWTLSLRGEAGLIGFCGLRFFGDSQEVEMLYALGPSYWGRGLATEAARATLRFGFEERGFSRIYAGADPPNVASFRVMERLGMRFAMKTRVDGLEVVYYDISRDRFVPDDALYVVHRV